MKKFLVALVLASGVGAIAFASMSSNSSNKQAIEKKTEKQEKKKECKKKCLFS
jgi:type II secretory pathway component PulJ